MDIQDSIEGYVQAAAHWRDVAEKEKIDLQDTQGNLWGADSVLAVADDRIEADILDSIIAGVLQSVRDAVGFRPGIEWRERAVKIEDGCPNEACVLGDR